MADQERQSGVQPAGDAQHQMMQAGVGHAGDQALHLQLEQRLQVVVGLRLVQRQERVLADFAQQALLAGGFPEGDFGLAVGRKALAGAQDVAVQVAGKGKALQRKGVLPKALAGVLGQHLTALADGGVPLKGHRMGGVPLAAAHKGDGDAKALGEGANQPQLLLGALGRGGLIAGDQHCLTAGPHKARQVQRQVAYWAGADAEAQLPTAKQGVPAAQGGAGALLLAVVPCHRVGRLQPSIAGGGQISGDLAVLQHRDDVHRLAAKALDQADDDAAFIFGGGHPHLVERILALGADRRIEQQCVRGGRAERQAGEQGDVGGLLSALLQQVGDRLAAELRVAADDAVDTAGESNTKVHIQHPFVFCLEEKLMRCQIAFIKGACKARLGCPPDSRAFPLRL